MSEFPLAGINVCGEFLVTRNLAWTISGHQKFSCMHFWWPEILPYMMGSESWPAQSAHSDVFRNLGALIPYGGDVGLEITNNQELFALVLFSCPWAPNLPYPIVSSCLTLYGIAPYFIIIPCHTVFYYIGSYRKMGFIVSYHFIIL